MREIKFRAWDKYTSSMKGVGEIIFNKNRVWLSDGEERVLDDVHEVILMQYTGLKDKNNKEVFEGDVLKVYEVSDYKEQEYISSVDYIQSNFVVTETNDTQVPLACFHDLDNTYPLFEIEVVGNIYEN